MRKAILWILALLLTLASAVYQRMTGPTHPLRGKTDLGGTSVSWRLPRSADSVRDCGIEIAGVPTGLSGYLEYRRHKTDDAWTRIEMSRGGKTLAAALPKQPPAGKLDYRVVLAVDGLETPLNGGVPAVIRFKGEVPAAVLIPHILIMFLAMLLSARAGLAALGRTENPRRLVILTCAALVLGGFVLGPLMQHYAFGAFWTGFPLGSDLTDTKTLVAMIAWLAALIAGRKGRPARGWVLAAAIVMLIVFSIPHSLLGSELVYPPR